VFENVIQRRYLYHRTALVLACCIAASAVTQAPRARRIERVCCGLLGLFHFAMVRLPVVPEQNGDTVCTSKFCSVVTFCRPRDSRCPACEHEVCFGARNRIAAATRCGIIDGTGCAAPAAGLLCSGIAGQNRTIVCKSAWLFHWI